VADETRAVTVRCRLVLDEQRQRDRVQPLRAADSGSSRAGDEDTDQDSGAASAASSASRASSSASPRPASTLVRRDSRRR
jgi:hypothetical protein